MAASAGVAILLTFWLRIWHINATSLWYDEIFVLVHAERGLIEGMCELFLNDNALPLHGFLLAMWVQVAGSGEFAARYLSVLLGTITAPLVYRLSRAVSGRRISGLGTLLAYATLPIFVYYSQEVRMYALAVPLTVAFAWSGWRLVTGGKAAGAYTTLGLLMLMAHPYTGLAWLVVGLWGTLWILAGYRIPDDHVLPLPRRQRSWWHANLLLVTLTVPILLWARWRVEIDATAVSAIPVAAIQWIPVFFGVGQYLAQPWSGVFVTITLLAILATLILCLSSGSWRQGLWHLLGLSIPIAGLFLLTSIKAKWSERYLVPSWGIALVVAVGSGWELLLQQDAAHWKARALRALGALLALSWIGLTLPAVARQAEGTWAIALRDEWRPRPDFRETARYISEHDDPADAIVVVGGHASATLGYYYDGPAHLFGLPFDTQILDKRRIVDLQSLEVLARETEGAQRLWLVLWQDHLADPTGLIQSVLVERCRRLPVYTNPINVGLLLFDLDRCRPLDRMADPAVVLEIPFQAPIRLLGYDVIRTDETWEVNLWWEALGPLSEDYSAFVHLTGPDGTIVAQHDRLAGAEHYPTGTWYPGVRLRNRFFLDVPGSDCPNCRLRVGLYTARGRLLVFEGQDAIELAIP